jgi:BirA family transcriptional regulator, biotin operon repressor / biotin---[acetyl-CoA-carboxylase] ligase
MPGHETAEFSIPLYRSHLRAAWLGRDLHYLSVVSSTMVAAKYFAAGGAPSGAAVLAEEQTDGHGRLGRRWLSPPGINLYFSVILRPPADRLAALAMMLPLAIADGLHAATGLDCRLKWPNDVQVGGRKIAGVLIETATSGKEPLLTIAGSGINVNYDPSKESEIAALATSVLRETGRTSQRELILAACMSALERWYEGPIEAARQIWRARLSTLGQTIMVSNGRTVERGVAEDVCDDGSLVLLRDDGSRLFVSAGDVTLATGSPG